MAEPLSPTITQMDGTVIPRPKDAFGNPMRLMGEEGWSLLDMLPAKGIYGALTREVTPQYDIAPTAGNVGFQATAPVTPQYGYLDTVAQAEAQQQQARAQQMALNEAILARARGEGPSVAEMQLRQATDRLQGQQAGLVASQRGMNPALQRRLIMSQAANAQQQMNAQGALLRAQEQQAAQALGAQSLGQMRGQDQSMFGQGASASQAQNALSAGTQMDAQRINAQVASQNAAAEIARMNLEAQRARDEANAKAGMIGGAASAVTGAPISLKGVGSIGSPYDMSGGPMASDPYYDLSGGPMPPDPNYDMGFAYGGMVPQRRAPGMAGGGMVPGTPDVMRDSPKNDKVPAWLTPKEVVLPLSVTQAPDAPKKAAEFMAMMQARPQAKSVSPAMRLMRGGK